MDYQIYRLNPDGTEEAVGMMHNAPDKTSPGFAHAFCTWVTTQRKGDNGACGYEAREIK